MTIRRMTARKAKIKSIVSGKWVKREGMEPSFVITDYGEKISRARILGTVVSRFIAEDGNFGSLTLDDGTNTIRVKTFKTVKPVDKFSESALVDVIGKVREYNGEIYMIPEIITPVEDPNFESLRKLEIEKRINDLKSGSEKNTEIEYEVEKKETQSVDENTVRKEVMELIQSDPEGVSFSLIMEKVNAPEEAIEKAINTILEEGICYEPVPGKIKKI